MARLYLFAEGRTEQTFADTVLKPHLAEYGVFMHGPVLIAHAHKKHRTHRGGGRNFQAMQMAERIGLPMIRCKCLHFDRWIGRLQKLAA